MLAEGSGKPKGPPKNVDSTPGQAKPSKQAEEIADKHVRKLTWVTDQKIVEEIEKAERIVTDLVEDSEGLMLWYDDYGAEWIKKHGRLAVLRSEYSES
jgi:hypothetical protein